jgi:lipoyl(octanoyl) transferase
MHGFALNVNPDLSAFRTIIPCGIADADVTSLEKELKKSITVDDVAPLVERHIFESLKKVSI